MEWINRSIQTSKAQTWNMSPKKSLWSYARISTVYSYSTVPFCTIAKHLSTAHWHLIIGAKSEQNISNLKKKIQPLFYVSLVTYLNCFCSREGMLTWNMHGLIKFWFRRRWTYLACQQALFHEKWLELNLQKDIYSLAS